MGALGHAAIKRATSCLGSWNYIHPDVAHSATLGVETLGFGRVAAMVGVTFLISIGAVGATSGWNYIIQKVFRKFAGELLGQLEGEFFESSSILDTDGVAGVDTDDASNVQL